MTSLSMAQTIQEPNHTKWSTISMYSPYIPSVHFFFPVAANWNPQIPKFTHRRVLSSCRSTELSLHRIYGLSFRSWQRVPICLSIQLACNSVVLVEKSIVHLCRVLQSPRLQRVLLVTEEENYINFCGASDSVESVGQVVEFGMRYIIWLAMRWHY